MFLTAVKQHRLTLACFRLVVRFPWGLKIVPKTINFRISFTAGEKPQKNPGPSELVECNSSGDKGNVLATSDSTVVDRKSHEERNSQSMDCS